MKEFEILKDLKFREFENDPLNMNVRRSVNFSDEFVVRKARIYQCKGIGDDRLQVQIIPELMGIPDDELDNLPIYPAFEKGRVITGRSVKEDGDSADYVWVICTPDFQVGYVLATANIFGEVKERYKDSYSFNNVQEYLSQRQSLPDKFEYNNIQVVRWVSTDIGGMIELYNLATGDWVLLNMSGSILTVQQQKIFMRVGSPADPPENKAGFSLIDITADQIKIQSPNIHIDSHGGDLILGHNNLCAAAMGSSTPAADNGVPVIPIHTIKM